MSEVDRNYKYFKSNFDEIVKGHIGKFVAINDCKVIKYYPSIVAAYDDMIKNGYKLGTFIIQECLKNINDNMIIIYNSVYIPA